VLIASQSVYNLLHIQHNTFAITSGRSATKPKLSNDWVQHELSENSPGSRLFSNTHLRTFTFIASM